jgi:hypothetical protein
MFRSYPKTRDERLRFDAVLSERSWHNTSWVWVPLFSMETPWLIYIWSFYRHGCGILGPIQFDVISGYTPNKSFQNLPSAIHKRFFSTNKHYGSLQYHSKSLTNIVMQKSMENNLKVKKKCIIWNDDDKYGFNVEFNGFRGIYLWKNHSWID